MSADESTVFDLPAAGYTTSGGTGGASQWGILAYSVSTVPSSTYLQSLTSYIIWICVTNETDSNFTAEPSYLQQMIANLTITSSGGGGSGNPVANIGYLVPLYSYPTSGNWDRLLSDLEAQPEIPCMVIANPANGVGDGVGESGSGGVDPNYTTYIKKMQNAGVTVLGYVGTGYGSVSTGNAEQNILDWKNWYNVDGIFLDEMWNVTGLESYYSGLTSYAHSLGLPVVVGNPGTSTIASYVGTVDIIVSYESNGLPTSATVQSATTGTGGTASQWAIIADNVGVVPQASYFASISPYLAWVYITQLAAPPPSSNNPYNAVPSYEPTLLANIVQGGGTSGGSGGGVTSSIGIGYFMPMRIYPGKVWDDFITIKTAYPVVPIAVCVDASGAGGPGSSADPGYVTYIQKMQAAGIKVLGVVDTQYGLMTHAVSIAAAEALIDDWYSWYNVDGIYLDNMDYTNNSTNAAYYGTLTSYVHNKKVNQLVFGNTEGPNPPAVYLGKVDVISTYDNSGLPSAATVDADTIAIGGGGGTPTSYINNVYVYSTVAQTGKPDLTTGFLLGVTYSLVFGPSVTLTNLTIKDLTTGSTLLTESSVSLDTTYILQLTGVDIQDHVIQYKVTASVPAPVKLSVQTRLDCPPSS